MKTVKRKAKVGERILITDKTRGETRYENGAIGDVTESNYTGIFAKINLERCGIFHEEYEVITEEANEMKKIIVENLVGRGLTGVITKEGKQYATYKDFARAAGYPESVYNDVSAVDGEKVNILAKGNHGGDYATIYVVENMDGEKYLIGTEGVEIEGKPELGVIEQMQVELARTQGELAELKSKVAALEGGKAGVDLSRNFFNYNWEIPGKSPQQIRDEIVAKAKADVEALLDAGYDSDIDHPRGTPYYGEFYEVDFVVNREKRTVVALAYQSRLVGSSEIFRRVDDHPNTKGIAKADPSDCFNVHIGKAIALRRALGLEVPAEYYNAPAPTEVRVGDVVWYSGRYPRLTVAEVTDLASKEVGLIFLTKDSSAEYKIIDDSRE